MGNRFDCLNAKPTIWLEPLLLRRPACFDSHQWATYLDGVRREIATARATSSLRKQLERGGMPPYCDVCEASYRDAMQRQERCQPQLGAPKLSETPT